MGEPQPAPDPLDGFPVTYTPVATRAARCTLCVEMFTLDRRGLPVLTHPELGAIVVCYRCATDLGHV